MADNTAAKAEYKDYYTEDLDLTDSTKDVLIRYSKIPEDKLDNHVRHIVRISTQKIDHHSDIL